VTAARLVDDPLELGVLAPDWWDLWYRVPEATPFSTPAWLLPWWRRFAPGELRALAVEHERRLIALAPLYLERGSLGSRLLPVGFPHSGYFDVLIDPSHAALAREALRDGLEALRDWTEVSFEETPPGAAALAIPRPAACDEERTPQSAWPVLDLAVSEARPAACDRRSLRSMLDDASDLGEFEIAKAAEDEIPTFLATLADLRAGRRRQSDGPPDPRVPAFHADAAPILHAAAMLRLTVLRVGDRPAASYLGLVAGPRAYGLLAGFDPALAGFRASELLVAAMIDDAILGGCTSFHFLRGLPCGGSWGATERSNTRRVIRRLAAA
jgi:CelD/BcsL family acetyltransferase involved in cellulose biosynthesis